MTPFSVNTNFYVLLRLFTVARVKDFQFYWSFRNQFIPINLTDSFLEVGIVNPENIQAIDALTLLEQWCERLDLFYG